MAFRTYTVLTLLVTSTAAFAWRPVTYPIRSQSPYERSIDNAMCYAEANRATGVNMAHEPQVPPRQPPAAKGASTGVPSRPPLPPSSFSATPLPWSASAPEAASAPMAGAQAPAGASSVKAETEAAAGASAPGAPATAAANASAAATGTSASAAPGASDGATASMQANAASNVKLPPLPAPEPPMTRYWAAYGACMQARGYVVQ
ncbi:hypothetical protein BJG93_09905 [Paraburkholderia sprentiae WSM5005]|uniref:Uncharacterized protein n=1 Tax=Paraburkholderia sprentiae WSM5005 TaxID=754502 RepID=A0A1I9YH86_9BURK|nr:hypothetical protein [Paraburkholderia sprentiae]APA85669.1 hypothetical protein BJG93_09905 [Paraburkholderia sprentiae WSM5005]